MPASYTIRRSVPRNTRRSKPASTPSTCFPSFSINLFMAFPLPRGDLSSNTTNIIREQKTPSPFGCGYAALCIISFRTRSTVDSFCRGLDCADRSPLDEIRHGAALRNIDCMASLHFDGVGTGPLRHQPSPKHVHLRPDSSADQSA